VTATLRTRRRADVLEEQCIPVTVAGINVASRAQAGGVYHNYVMCVNRPPGLQGSRGSRAWQGPGRSVSMSSMLASWVGRKTEKGICRQGTHPH